MTFFNYTQGIPAAQNNPSNDQPNMKVNNDSNYLIWDVDHYGFEDNNGGQHQWVTLPKLTTPATQVDPSCVIYTANGSTGSHPQAFLKNSQASFPMSALRAFGTFNSVHALGAVSVLNSYNVSAVACTVAGGSSTTYTITLTNNCTDSNNIVFLSSYSKGSIPNFDWSYVAPTITITVNDTTVGRKIGFTVIQA